MHSPHMALAISHHHLKEFMISPLVLSACKQTPRVRGNRKNVEEIGTYLDMVGSPKRWPASDQLKEDGTDTPEVSLQEIHTKSGNITKQKTLE